MVTCFWIESTQAKMDTESGSSPQTRLFYWKNLLGISTASLFLFMPTNLFFGFLSSLYPEDGLGTWTVSVCYVAQLCTSMFIPPVLMQKFGCKGTLVISALLMVPFISANFFPSFLTLMPGSILFGIGFGILIAVVNTTSCHLAYDYAKFTGTQPNKILSVFLGIANTITESSFVWINIVASFLLRPENEEHHPISYEGFSCGSDYCNEMEDENFISRYLNVSSAKMQSPVLVTHKKLFMLCAASLTSVAVAFILTVTLIDYKGKEMVKETDIKSSILSALRLLRNPNQLLLIIITISGAAPIAFFLADFTKAFVTCSIQARHVATVTIVFGIILITSSTATGYIIKATKALPFFMMTIPLTLALFAAMIFWTPSPDDLILLHVVGGFWGLISGMWLVFLAAVYGETFPEDLEAAFSNHRFFQSLGYALGFGWSSLFCIRTKMIMQTVWVLCGSIGYVIFEIRVRKIKAYVPLQQ